MESGDGRGAGRVDGLNVNDDERRTTIEIKDHDVWLLRQAGAIPAHPSLHGGVTAGARALGYDAALAEGGGEDDDKGLTHMVMDGGVEAYAVGASDEMATVGCVEMSAASTIAQCVQAGAATSCGGQRRRSRVTRERAVT